MKVAVIGGGPAGLATLKFLATAHLYFPIPPLEVRLFEAEGEIGGTFVRRVYEDAELVSSKYLTAFSDFRLPLDARDFVTPKVYVQYLNDYVDHFHLRAHIHTHTRVVRVSRGSPTGHFVEVESALPPSDTTGDATDRETEKGKETWECDAVAICTGINVTPRIPAIPGIDRVPLVLHSSDLKTRAQLGRDTHVVVLGAGETGMDVAHLAVTAPTASVTLCHRDGFFCAPKIIPRPNPRGRSAFPGTRNPNKPVDTSVASLFDTAYAHPMLQRSPLLWLAYDLWVRKMHWCIGGTEEGPDQWVGAMRKERKHLDSLFMCKSDRALPYISAGHRSTSWLNRIRSAILNVPIRSNHGRTISVRRWPVSIDSSGIIAFQDDNPPKLVTTSPPVKPDVLILATGYNTSFPFLCPSSAYPSLPSATTRGIYCPSDPTVSFIGFVRPSIGAIPPLAELQAQLWTLRLLQHIYPPSLVARTRSPDAVPPYELDWRLRPRAGYDLWTDKRGVDHESYAYQLALDMGAAPTVGFVVRRGWRVAYTWAMGSNFNTKFRLVGPWAERETAEAVMRGELYGVVKRSGGVVYLVTYSIIPLVCFGTISLTLYGVFFVASLPHRAWEGMKSLFRRNKTGQKIVV